MQARVVKAAVGRVGLDVARVTSPAGGHRCGTSFRIWLAFKKRTKRTKSVEGHHQLQS